VVHVVGYFLESRAHSHVPRAQLVRHRDQGTGDGGHKVVQGGPLFLILVLGLVSFLLTPGTAIARGTQPVQVCHVERFFSLLDVIRLPAHPPKYTSKVGGSARVHDVADDGEIEPSRLGFTLVKVVLGPQAPVKREAL
jgi:hypothetical protein